MSKYTEFMEDVKQNHSVLLAIANELAEANRLKRIELEMRAGSFRYHEARFKDMIKDRA